MRSEYANAFNVTGGCEEIALLFGGHVVQDTGENGSDNRKAERERSSNNRQIMAMKTNGRIWDGVADFILENKAKNR